MTGQEVRDILLAKKYVLSDIADMLKISAQTLNSRLNAKNFKKEYIEEIEQLLGISISAASSKNLIPFYDDVSSIGGVKGVVASPDGVSSPSDYIDTGDWFKEATAAIRHYGESMIEYPQGCILALKEVKERKLVVWGRDYVVETNEYRITKRIQRGEDKEHIRAYSTNEDTYPDGRIIHEPLDIEWNDVRCIYAVLGYVVKKNGGTMIFSNSK